MSIESQRQYFEEFIVNTQRSVADIDNDIETYKIDFSPVKSENFRLLFAEREYALKREILAGIRDTNGILKEEKA